MLELHIEVCPRNKGPRHPQEAQTRRLGSTRSTEIRKRIGRSQSVHEGPRKQAKEFGFCPQNETTEERHTQICINVPMISLITIDCASHALKVSPPLQTLSPTRAGFESVLSTAFPFSSKVHGTAQVLNRQ